MENWEMPTTTNQVALLDDQGTDASFRRLVYGVFTLSVNFERIRNLVASALNLSGIQYHILMVVAELSKERTVSVTDVAGKLHTSGAYVTTEVKKLVHLGLLDKKPNPEDKRSVVIALTIEGQNTIEEFAPFLREINDGLFGAIGPETFKTFLAIVEHMTQSSTNGVNIADRIAREYSQIRSGTNDKLGLTR